MVKQISKISSMRYVIVFLLMFLGTGHSFAFGQGIDPVTQQPDNGKEGERRSLSKDERPARKPPGLSAGLYKAYSEVVELLNQDIPDQERALFLLKNTNFEIKSRTNAFERAVFYNLIASIYQSQENYDEAILYYKKVLEQEPLGIANNIDVPYDLLDGANFLIGQLYVIKGEYKSAHIYLNNWLAYQVAPIARNLIFIANAYYLAAIEDGIERAEAEGFIRTAISLTNRAVGINELSAKESWYVFLRSLHYYLNEDQNVFDITEILISRWSKKQYWIELSSLYASAAAKDGIGENEAAELEKMQLVALETVHRQGLLSTGRELETISQLFLYHEIPYKSSKTLEKALTEGVSEPTYKNFDLLSIAYLQGKDIEKAIEPLSKAAELSENGELFMRLANVYLQMDQYQEAASSINAAIEKGGVDRPDLARFLQGQAYMALEDFDRARASFRMAAEDERTVKNANTWLKYMINEEQRVKDIKEYLN